MTRQQRLTLVATILGCLLLGPPAIRIFSGVAGRLSIAPRLALRDLVRYQARSGAALAAVSLALGIAAAVVVVASAEAAKRNAKPANLSDRQVRVYLGRPKTREVIPAQAVKAIDRLSASVHQIADRLGDANVVPLSKAFMPGTPTFFDPVAGFEKLPDRRLVRRYAAVDILEASGRGGEGFLRAAKMVGRQDDDALVGEARRRLEAERDQPVGEQMVRHGYASELFR